jgi:ribosomal protein S18 acetylase RimI-like enzyme
MDNKIQFRTDVIAADIENIREIIVSTGFFYDHEVPVAVSLAEERLQHGLESGYYFVFVEIDNKTVAYSCYGEIACTIGSYDLYWIATHNDYRGKGIGKQLLEKTHQLIKHVGGRLIIAETSSTEKYLPTRTFYESNKYIQEAQIKDFYQSGDDKCMYIFRL